MRAIKNTFVVMAVVCSGAVAAQPSAGFSENFNTMNLNHRVSHNAALSCQGGLDDPENLSMAFNPVKVYPPGQPPAIQDGIWGMLSSSQYPLTWNEECTSSQTTACSQAWALNDGYNPSSDGVLHTHAQKHVPSDDGHAFISLKDFDRSKYLTLIARMSVTHCHNDAAGCFAGLSLIATEADYREIALSSTGGKDSLGRQLYTVSRYAPCIAQPFTFKNYDGTQERIVTVPGDTFHTLRLDYLGPEGGGWRYFLNGREMRLPDMDGVYGFGEKGTDWNASLNGNPHVGLYWAAPAEDDYVEGRVDDVVVHQLEKVNPLSATASNNSTDAWKAIDGDTTTQWNAGGFAPNSIDLNLNGVFEVKKVRLLTSQSPDGYTVHRVCIGNSLTALSCRTVSGNTTDNTWLELDLIGRGMVGQFVRVETVQSDSWVAWREIEVYR